MTLNWATCHTSLVYCDNFISFIYKGELFISHHAYTYENTHLSSDSPLDCLKRPQIYVEDDIFKFVPALIHVHQ